MEKILAMGWRLCSQVIGTEMRDCLKPFLTHGWSLGEKRIEAAPPPPPQVSVQSALPMQRELLNILSYLVVVLPEVLEAEPDRLALSELERDEKWSCWVTFETSGNSERQAVFFIVFFRRRVGKAGRVRRREGGGSEHPRFV